MAAHGVSIVEIAREGGELARPCSTANTTAASARPTTPMSVDGPAAGHDRLKTSADPSGASILGTLNNCAGGLTPWGTYLTAEENFHGYFWSDLCATGGKPPTGLGGAQAKSYERYGVPGLVAGLGQVRRPLQCRQGAERAEPVRLDRRDRSVRRQLGAGEAHRAWPLPPRGRRDASSTRMAASSSIAATMRASTMSIASSPTGRYDPDDRAANMTLLSAGTLSVARFDDDGSVEWLPLVFGQGPLTPENGFQLAGRRGDRRAARRRPARRDPHGPARGRAAQSRSTAGSM